MEARKIKVTEVVGEEEVMELPLLVAQGLAVADLPRGRGQHMALLLQKIPVMVLHLHKILILVMVLPDLSNLHLHKGL